MNVLQLRVSKAGVVTSWTSSGIEECPSTEQRLPKNTTIRREKERDKDNRSNKTRGMRDGSTGKGHYLCAFFTALKVTMGGLSLLP